MACSTQIRSEQQSNYDSVGTNTYTSNIYYPPTKCILNLVARYLLLQGTNVFPLSTIATVSKLRDLVLATPSEPTNFFSFAVVGVFSAPGKAV